jgi:succinate dehydrogenase/fumarate reductase cytochrome b subunit
MLVSQPEPILRTRGTVAREWAWLALATATLLWPSVVTQIGSLARQAASSPVATALRLFALLLALALRAAGAFVLLRRQAGSAAGRRLRLRGQLATIAPVVHTVLRVPQLGVPAPETWFAIVGATLTVSLLRSVTARGASGGSGLVASPSAPLLRVHRWSALVIVTFAALHMAGHLTAFVSLELNLAVVDRLRSFYKQPLFEGLLLAAVPVQVVTGLLLYRAGRNRASGFFYRLQLASGLYLAVFIAAHTMATAVLFRNITFYAATGASHGVFTDPIFMTYYVLGPLAVFAHVACALRVMLARRVGRARAERWAVGTLAVSGALCVLIALALSGVHLANDRQLPGVRRKPAPVRRWLGSTRSVPSSMAASGPSSADR